MENKQKIYCIKTTQAWLKPINKGLRNTIMDKITGLPYGCINANYKIDYYLHNHLVTYNGWYIAAGETKDAAINAYFGVAQNTFFEDAHIDKVTELPNLDLVLLLMKLFNGYAKQPYNIIYGRYKYQCLKYNLPILKDAEFKELLESLGYKIKYDLVFREPYNNLTYIPS